MLNQSNQENVHTLRIVEVCDDGEIVYATGPMDRASSAPEGGISVYLDLNAAFNPMPSAMIVVAEGLVEDGVEIAHAAKFYRDGRDWTCTLDAFTPRQVVDAVKKSLTAVGLTIEFQ